MMCPRGHRIAQEEALTVDLRRFVRHDVVSVRPACARMFMNISKSAVCRVLMVVMVDF